MRLDGEEINFDTNRIKVTVTSSFEQMENNKYPIVKLKRLTISEIESNTSKRIERIKPIRKIMTRSKTRQMNENNHGSSCLKRNSDVPTCYLTFPKKQKLTKDMKLPPTEIVSVENFENKNQFARTSCKRRGDVPAHSLTQQKKQKISKDKKMPPTSTVRVNEEKSNSEIPRIENSAVAVPDLAINEVVWAKIKGANHWPAKILSIQRHTRFVKFEIWWFNDYRKSVVFRSQLFKFYSNFEVFAEKFPSTVGLETAAKEALIYLASQKKH